MNSLCVVRFTDMLFRLNIIDEQQEDDLWVSLYVKAKVKEDNVNS